MKRAWLLLLGLLPLTGGVQTCNADQLETVLGVSPDYAPRPATEVFLNGPTRVLSAGGNAFYFSEPGNRLIKVDAEGVLSVFAQASPVSPGATDTDAEGNYFFSVGSGIAKVSRDGEPSIAHDFFSRPALRLLRDPSAIASNCNGGDSLAVSNANGIFLLPGGTAVWKDSGAFARRIVWCPPVGLRWIDRSQRRVYGDSGLIAGSELSGVPLDGQSALETSFSYLVDLAVDREERIYVADRSPGTVYIIHHGVVERFAGSPDGADAKPGMDAAAARFLAIDSIALDSAGRLLIVDSDAFAVWRVNEDRTLSRVAGQERQGKEGAVVLSQPTGLAYDGAGNLYVVDRLNFRILLLKPDGSVDSVAGTGVRPRSLEFGAATEIAIAPDGPIAVGNAEWIYFIEQGGGAVRRFQRGGLAETFLTVDELGEVGGGRFTGLGTTGTGDVLVSLQDRILAVGQDKRPYVRVELSNPGDAVQNPAVFAVLEDDSIVIPGQSSQRPGFFRFAASGQPEFIALASDGPSVPCNGPFSAIAATPGGFTVAKPGALCRFTLDGRGTVIAGAIGRQMEPVLARLGAIDAIAALPDGSVVFAERDTNLVRKLAASTEGTSATFTHQEGRLLSSHR